MADKKYEVGLLVRHPTKPEWGIGKIVALDSNVAKIHFKNDQEEYRAFSLARVRLEPAEIQSDVALDNLPPFLGDRFDVDPKRVSFYDGLSRFTKIFPLAFADSGYLERERNYKWDAHQRYEEELGGGRGERLLQEGAIVELSERASAIATMNLLSLFETLAFRDGLRANEGAARKYFEALFGLLREGPTKEPFERLARAVSDLPAEKGKARVASWPILTLIPYLARPDLFMFLKPEPTRSCADRLRFHLQYRPTLNWVTYSKLLELSEELKRRLSNLRPKDYIDVQSFMWVMAKYERPLA